MRTTALGAGAATLLVVAAVVPGQQESGGDNGCCVYQQSCVGYENPGDNAQKECEASGGIWLGNTGSPPCPADCNSGLGACCRNDGWCVVSNEAWCRLVIAPGNTEWMGAGTTCEVDCSLGACCLADDFCTVVPLAFCNGVWNAGQECGAPDSCVFKCRSDLSGDGVVDIVDFLTLLADWGVCP